MIITPLANRAFKGIDRSKKHNSITIFTSYLYYSNRQNGNYCSKWRI